MKTILISIFILLVLVVTSCQFGKKQIEERNQMPEWVMTKPQNSLYYIGVSSSPKKGFLPSEFMSNAQQKALADMSSSISVRIESTSVLSLIETNYVITENFSSEIIASTNQQLEGYELVDTWEDNNYYWVYYRLLKTDYQSHKEEIKQQTILDAKNKYYQAKELIGRQLHYNAFLFYIEALTILKPYLGEKTITDIDGEEKDLGNVLFCSIDEFVNSLQIVFKTEEITVKKGVALDPTAFSFKIIDQRGFPVSGIPVKINYSGTGLLRNSEVSGYDGKIYPALKKIKSTANVETMSVSIDMLSFSRSAKDPTIRSLIKNIPASSSSIRIIIEKPSLKIFSEEKSFGKIRNDSNVLQSTFEGLLGSDFIINNSETPDYVLKISSNTTKNGENYGESIVTMNYTFDLTDSNGNVIYRKTSATDFAGNTFIAADNLAYIEVTKSIERIIALELIGAINK